MPLSEKKQFDLAMSKELTNVAVSKALRAVSEEELSGLDARRVINMQWVLSREADGSPKARLVVLGFQAHNLTEVATASHTMSKASRNILLSLAACLKLIVRAGDVTGAFLQTGRPFRLGTPELSAVFGAEAGECQILRVLEAFYGLVHAPRKWHERCVQTNYERWWLGTDAWRPMFLRSSQQWRDPRPCPYPR